MKGHKASLNKLKTEIISTIFSDHHSLKIEINKKKARNFTNTWKLNNTLLNNKWAKEEIKRENKKTS